MRLNYLKNVFQKLVIKGIGLASILDVDFRCSQQSSILNNMVNTVYNSFFSG